MREGGLALITARWKVIMKPFSLLLIGFSLVAFVGCSPVGGGLLGGALGAGAASGGYEYHLKRQKDRVENDFKGGVIDQKEYEIRKDQIIRDSLLNTLR